MHLPCEQGLAAVTGHSKKKKKKKNNPTCICSKGGAIIAVLLPLFVIAMSVFVVGMSLCPPCIHCSCPAFVVPTCTFCCCHIVIPAIHSLLLSPLSPAVCCACYPLSPPSAVPYLSFIVIAVHLHIIVCKGVLSIVVSTTSFPYEQWLAGRVGVLCDVAWGGS